MLIPLGEGRIYNKIMFFGLMLSCASVFLLVQKYGAIGASITSLICEVFVMTLLVRWVNTSQKLRY